MRQQSRLPRRHRRRALPQVTQQSPPFANSSAPPDLSHGSSVPRPMSSVDAMDSGPLVFSYAGELGRVGSLDVCRRLLSPALGVPLGSTPPARSKRDRPPRHSSGGVTPNCRSRTSGPRVLAAPPPTLPRQRLSSPNLLDIVGLESSPAFETAEYLPLRCSAESDSTDLGEFPWTENWTTLEALHPSTTFDGWHPAGRI